MHQTGNYGYPNSVKVGRDTGMNHVEHRKHQHFTQFFAVPAGEFNWLVVTADDQRYKH